MPPRPRPHLGAPWMMLPLLWGCSASKPVAQLQTSLVAEQVSAVPAALPNLGIGGHLPRGAVSLTGGVGAVGNEPQSDVPLGQQVAPVLGVGRLAMAVSNDVELVLSGSVSPIGPAPRALGLSPLVLDGWAGRGHFGIRYQVPFRSPVQWSISHGVGALGTIYRRVDTATRDARSWDGELHETERTVYADVGRVVPDLSTGTTLSLPLTGGAQTLRVVGGLQVQTWPVYWGTGGEGETCTRFTDLSLDCSSYDNLPGRPSHTNLVFTPSVGVALQLGVATLHAQGFVHTGPEDLGRNPYGAMLALEYWIAGGGNQD